MAKAWSVLAVLACLTFFDTGCTAAQRKELLDEAKEYAKTNLLPEAKKAAEDYINKKLAEAEEKKKAELDLALSEFKVKDANGLDTIKTWKDFDEDKDGSLSPKELAKIGAWVATERAKGGGNNPAAGGAAAALIALGGIWVAKKGVGAVAKKTNPPPTV